MVTLFQTDEEAARLLGLRPNAPKELIEEAYRCLLSQTAELASPERERRIAELGDAYLLLCRQYSSKRSELRGPRSHSLVHALRRDTARSESHELLAVDAEASAPIIQAAVDVQVARLGHSVVDDGLRREIHEAGVRLLSGVSTAEHVDAGPQRAPSPASAVVHDTAGLQDRAAPPKNIAELSEELSAKRVMTAPQAATAILLVVWLVVGIAIAPLDTFTILIAIVTAFYIVAMGYKALLVIRSVSSSCDTTIRDEDVASLRDEELPVYTVLVPLYHEANVLNHLVRALAKLDYPRDRLDVKLLLEADDHETRSVAEGLDLPSHVEVLVVPPTHESQGKPRACNYGLRHARGEYVVLYDAEDIPDPLQLKKALLAFRQTHGNVGCVQAKLTFFNANQNLLTRWFTVEYSTWFDLYLPGLNSVAAPIPLGGTSNHFPTDVIRRAGGWDAFNVTEDADLGTRMARLGLRTLLIDSWTLEEANSQLGNWLRQRSRWVKGYMQTWLVHMRNPVSLYRELGGRGVLAFQVMIFGTFFVYFLNPVFWLLVAIWYSTSAAVIQHLFPGPVLYLATLSLFAGNFFFLVIGMVAVLKRGYFEGVKYVLVSYIYWAMMSVAAWKALYQLAARPHYWEKTKHGLARAPISGVGEAD